ncbi:hypothetical protein ACDW_15410 [Acidovorax sp. DW039]|uniref:hypothetical protein n=1 Tax=Acidovorax sp. DW039 TaxID=3095606 RepID=UPI00308D32E2|nr:hypothetical protein ACDW_15410 [Acidovorax sp. DW039]
MKKPSLFRFAYLLTPAALAITIGGCGGGGTSAPQISAKDYSLAEQTAVQTPYMALGIAINVDELPMAKSKRVYAAAYALVQKHQQLKSGGTATKDTVTETACDAGGSYRYRELDGQDIIEFSDCRFDDGEELMPGIRLLTSLGGTVRYTFLTDATMDIAYRTEEETVTRYLTVDGLETNRETITSAFWFGSNAQGYHFKDMNYQVHYQGNNRDYVLAGEGFKATIDLKNGMQLAGTVRAEGTMGSRQLPLTRFQYVTESPLLFTSTDEFSDVAAGQVLISAPDKSTLRLSYTGANTYTTSVAAQ